METTSLLPGYSEKSEIVLSQLMKAKAEMGSTVKKDSNNTFYNKNSNKNTYASLGAHLELSESVLFSHGLLMLHTLNVINNQHILVATLHHPESGQWIRSYHPLPNPKGDSQGVGACITYMRRYSINSMLGLNAEDDDGETAAGRGKYEKQVPQAHKNPPIEPIEPPVIEKLGKTQIIALTGMINQLDKESDKSFRGWIKTAFNAESVQDIPKGAFEKCMVSLNAKIKYLNDQERAIA
jgi:hypothetical protein